MRVTAVYPGTFDPMTVGHIDVARRASGMFDDLVVAVAASTTKSPFFSLEERVDMATEILADLENVTVQSFGGLLVDYAGELGSKVIVRGLRAISDFEYEVQIAGVNRHLSPEIETVFIAASQEYTFLSSSIVREIARMQGDVSEFVHPIVIDSFARRHRLALHEGNN
ncbi:pantetheine-phosphate adenylyltransferase [Granulosicoccus antarcticus]|uniref:Phosphopantetheine adenylyltransferase n=1 Tax=Granulosicoccus antarcticus IMCC3135 TaxID=1192854 RepID=A0A2Z2NU44_9GAMM|nr:pantetheine-phosphate adenylyltransferase [Granulosicoccus antarcticus]ASJ71167.1 Phosphopantetheine adenylyltransferase [Granulosicoccus antarcticus IMCC3135]